jgi:nitrogen-specific signal transduction histidine kinase
MVSRPCPAIASLGLSQVFGFARQSGGDVHVVSQPGEGATFTLLLPQVDHCGGRVGRRDGMAAQRL